MKCVTSNKMWIINGIQICEGHIGNHGATLMGIKHKMVRFWYCQPTGTTELEENTQGQGYCHEN